MTTDTNRGFASYQLKTLITLLITGSQVKPSVVADETGLRVHFPTPRTIGDLANKRSRSLEISSPYKLLVETEFFVFAEGHSGPIYHEALVMSYVGQERSRWKYRTTLVPLFWINHGTKDGK